MRRRLIAAVSAVLLAVVGAAMLVAYVSGVDRRAAAGLDPTTVLVVTGADSRRDRCRRASPGTSRRRHSPRRRWPTALCTSITDITGQVAVSDLLPGEQLLAGRFADPAQVQADGPTQAPPGHQLVSVVLDPQRALGGRLAAGSKVAVFVSFTDPDTTSLTLRNVSVTGIQGGVSTEPKDGDTADPADASEPLPGTSVHGDAR